ncbi:MAG: bifunctional hydroxymethylpyrimidine kinase/phosphomethylpyrimidine kinase [Opitutaceae bacterium]|nr:bifunctional hydroxymethylpyrimidine kinase/phosphomethylpyrimidine kinase [Opitutaceae bacterium]
MESNTPSESLPVALSIAGSDSGAAAGIQADLLTFAANQVYGTTALTCVTAQNPNGVSAIHALPPEEVAAQIKQVDEYYKPAAVKTGMLFNEEIISAVCHELQKLSARPRIVVDPVMVASSGATLLQPEAISLIKSQLLPLATIVTPNLDEVEIIFGRKLENIADFEVAAANLSEKYRAAFLIKGGHLPGDNLFDVLAMPNGTLKTYEQVRILGIDTHGSGCTLSSAITAGLAKGLEIEEAVDGASRYLRAGMRQPLPISGTTFINHFPFNGH